MSESGYSSFYQSVNTSLQQVAKGSSFVFIGSIIGIIFLFLGRVIIAREFSQDEYGIFSLALIILDILAVIGAVGLQDGTARQIAYYHSKGNNQKTGEVVTFSLLIGLVVGIILTISLFLSAKLIAGKFFHLPELSLPLKIISPAIISFVLIYILTATLRGFGYVKEKVVFTDFIINFLFILLLLVIVWLNLAFNWAILSLSASIIFTSIIFIIYFLWKKRQLNIDLSLENLSLSTGKELLILSFPLLLVTMWHHIMRWTDTLMLGYYKTPAQVGLYNAAQPLARFISTALVSILFVYLPVIVSLHTQLKNEEMKKSYVTLTKWLCTATFPLAMIFILFPEIVLDFLFGNMYQEAALPLQILAFGFFINNLMGPNGATLTALGQTRFLMYVTISAAIINIGSNALLIPLYGVVGAAVATVIAMILMNIVRTMKLYLSSGIHFFKKNILAPVSVAGILIFVMYFLVNMFLVVYFWMLPILFMVFLLGYGLALLLTKSFEQEDIDLLVTIEQKTGIPLGFIRKVIKKFW